MKRIHTPNKYTFIFLALLFSQLKAYSQCLSTIADSSSSLTPTCASQTTPDGVNSGAYIYYSGFIPNTWYSFYLGNEPLTITCASANFTDSNQTVLGTWNNILNTTAYMQAPSNTSWLLIQTAGGWSSTSAALTYKTATPTDPTWSASPSQICRNATATYSVGATDYTTSYIWTVNGANYINGVPGQTTLDTSATSITVTFSDSSAIDSVSVYATNNGFCNSATALAVVYANQLAITAQPQNAFTCGNNSVNLSVTSSGCSCTSYQWQYNNGGTWVNISDGIPGGFSYTGGLSSTLSLNPGYTTTGGTYDYRVILSSCICGSDTSDSATVTVSPIGIDTINDTICPGTSYLGHSSAGTYVDTIINPNGCDTVRVLNLAVRNQMPEPVVIFDGVSILQIELPGYEVQWFFNGSPIPGDTNLIIHITETGLYSVQLTDSFGCTILSPAVQFDVTGIGQVAGNPQCTIFPNPTSGTLTIQAANLSAANKLEISIYDALGQKVMNKEEVSLGNNYTSQLNVQSLAPGIYEVQLLQGNASVRQKLVIER